MSAAAEAAPAAAAPTGPAQVIPHGKLVPNSVNECPADLYFAVTVSGTVLFNEGKNANLSQSQKLARAKATDMPREVAGRFIPAPLKANVTVNEVGLLRVL
jgi:hypothetical protein